MMRRKRNRCDCPNKQCVRILSSLNVKERLITTNYRMKTSIIVAKSENHIIGKDGQIPWRLPNDLKYFKKTTMGHPIIMGRKTHEGIGKPLPGRSNIVLSSRKTEFPGCLLCRSLEEALGKCLMDREEEVFIIGGASIYGQSFGFVDRLYITEIKAEIAGDTFLPFFDITQFKEVSRKSNKADKRHKFEYDFVVYDRLS